MNYIDHAIDYAKRGWAAFPLHTVRNGVCSCGNPTCSSPGKHPRVVNGVKEATTDQSTIQKWWNRWSDANIAIATGALSKLVVLDIDPRHGSNESLTEIIEQFGPIPNTVEVLTGGGGSHIFFQHPGVTVGNKVNLMPGLDIRADNGYVVAAPSVHQSGQVYEWELSSHPDETSIAPIPYWLFDIIRTPQYGNNSRGLTKSTSFKPQSYGDQIIEGGRNAALTSLAGSMHRRDMSFTAILAALLAENDARCVPPLSTQEVETIVKSVMRYEPSAPVTQQITAADGATTPAPSADTFFENGKFVPALLGDFMLVQNHFYYNGSQFFIYHDGVYKPIGEPILRKMLVQILGKKYKRSYMEEVVSYVQINSWRDTGVMNEDDGWINVKNGLLNWRTGQLKDHDPSRVTTLKLPIKYDPSAKCSAVQKFFSDIVPADTVPTVEELFGYVLIPSTRFEKAFMLTGVGANGKSTFINLLTRFIGEENTSNVPLQDMEHNRFKLAHLSGKLLNTFADLAPKALENSSVFKSVVSGDRMSAEFKGKDSFDFRPFARFVFSANEIPGSRDVGEAFFRRWVVIPFPNTFSHGGNADEKLIDKLTTDEELSGLLNMALEGLRRLDRNGQFTMNESTLEALAQYKRDTDSVATFLDEMCIITDDVRCGTKELYSEYSHWCDDAGLRPLGKINFNKRIQQRIPNLKKGRNTGQPEHWQGVRLIEQSYYGF